MIVRYLFTCLLSYLLVFVRFGIIVTIVIVGIVNDGSCLVSGGCIRIGVSSGSSDGSVLSWFVVSGSEF